MRPIVLAQVNSSGLNGMAETQHEDCLCSPTKPEKPLTPYLHGSHLRYHSRDFAAESDESHSKKGL